MFVCRPFFSYLVSARDDAGLSIGVLVPVDGHQRIVIQNHGNRIPDHLFHQVIANDDLVVIVSCASVITANARANSIGLPSVTIHRKHAAIGQLNQVCRITPHGRHLRL